MSKITDSQAVVIAAVIGVVGIIIGAIVTPLAKKWIELPATPENPKSLAIEQLPVSVFVYDGRDENLGGWSGLRISYLNSAPSYQFNYSIPTAQTSYAGIAFRFDAGQNLSKYQRVEFTIQFDGKESEHVIDFYLTDISGQKSHVRVTEIGSEKKKESELLSNFASANLNAIIEIVFNTDDSLVTGDHQVTISDIHFVP
jgi:hypothetical protein